MNRFKPLARSIVAIASSFVIATGSLVSGAAAKSDGLTVTLSADVAIKAGSPVVVQLTLTNNSNKTLRVQNWLVADEELVDDLFVVTRDGAAVAYLGPVVKRAAADEKDMLKIAAGESLARSIDLSAAYDFSKSGTYAIQYRADGDKQSNANKAEALVSNAVKLSIEGRSNASLFTPVPDATTSTVSFSGRCDATQQSTILSAVSAASNYANGANTYLNGSPSATARYTTWFGAFTTARWNTAKSHFAAIKDAFDNKPITVDCSCKKTYYAYVYPNRPYIIYVCRAFWSAPMTGTDSKGGTLIHEMSHFDVVASTDDWAYGQTNAKALAISDPAKALDNADSHEYFAENTPAQQ